MANDFSNRSAEALVLACGTVSAIITSPLNAYGVNALELTALTSSDTALTGAITAQANAQAAAKAATHTKAIDKQNVVNALTAIADTVYANAAVTDPMLAAIGFAPRRSGSTHPVAPSQVTELSATPFANGTAKLKWNRNGNRSGVIFVIEWSADGATWTFMQSTTRVSSTADGFAPGVAAWFRVTATNAVGSALPSASASIYAPAPPVSMLRAA